MGDISVLRPRNKKRMGKSLRFLEIITVRVVKNGVDFYFYFMYNKMLREDELCRTMLRGHAPLCLTTI